MMKTDLHTFLFRVCGTTYRTPCPCDEAAFESYMGQLEWRLPFNMRVAHSGTSSKAVLDTYPVVEANMDMFVKKRTGVHLITSDADPVNVLRMWDCFLVVETECGYGRLVEYAPTRDHLICEELYPIPFRQAADFVNQNHRHCSAPQGHKFSIGLLQSGLLTGVIIASHPKARALDDGYTLELTRCCVLEGQENACSKLYSRALRAGRSMGYRRFVTYTLPEEPGSSLKAVGFMFDGMTTARPKGWDHPARQRALRERYPTGAKCRWIIQDPR